MQNKAAKRAIAAYYILSFLLTLPLLLPFWLIREPIWVVVYGICFLLYMEIVSNLILQKTVMSALWKELDTEKYAAIINAKPFLSIILSS